MINRRYLPGFHSVLRNAPDHGFAQLHSVIKTVNAIDVDVDVSSAKSSLVKALTNRNTRRILLSFQEVVELGIWAEDFDGLDVSHLGPILAPVLKQVVEKAGWRDFEGFNIAGPWLQRLGPGVPPEILRWASELALKQKDPLSIDNQRIAAEFCHRGGNYDGLWQLFVQVHDELKGVIDEPRVDASLLRS